jgi:hypothetical protein
MRSVPGLLFKPFSTDNRDELFLAQWWFRTVAQQVHLGQVSTSIATADLVKNATQQHGLTGTLPPTLRDSCHCVRSASPEFGRGRQSAYGQTFFPAMKADLLALAAIALWGALAASSHCRCPDSASRCGGFSCQRCWLAFMDYSAFTFCCSWLYGTLQSGYLLALKTMRSCWCAAMPSSS